MDFRLKWYKSENQALEFPTTIQSVKKILLIAPTDHQELEAQVHDFASGLYTVFKLAQVSTFERSSFRPADGNWFGLPKEEYLDNFRQENFDLVIDLNLEQDRLCTYICALSGAGLRLNLSEGKYDHIYNFHIRTDKTQEIETRLQKVLQYFREFST